MPFAKKPTPCSLQGTEHLVLPSGIPLSLELEEAKEENPPLNRQTGVENLSENPFASKKKMALAEGAPSFEIKEKQTKKELETRSQHLELT